LSKRARKNTTMRRRRSLKSQRRKISLLILKLLSLKLI
jgi:hypothetical protein